MQTPFPNPTPRPTETPSPAATGTPVADLLPSAAPTLLPSLFSLQGPDISFASVTLQIAPALSEQLYVRTDPHAIGKLELSFQPEGYCRDVGCVTVYVAETYREEVFVGGQILDSLRAAIETQSMGDLPTVGAAILLQAQTRHVRFENGAGIRAIVMRGQDGFFANNEAVVVDFHGLSDDGRYYVVVTVPVDAPFLLSTLDPTANTNEAALPLPELPTDPAELAAVINEYNRQAEEQLEQLPSSSFVPDLGLIDALVSSLRLASPSGE